MALLVGGGCVVLLVLSAIVAAVVLYVVSRRNAASVAAGAPAGSGAASANLRAEVQDVRNFRDNGPAQHFVAEIHNTGLEPLGYPSAKITVFDAKGAALDSSTCTSLVRALEPGEKLPCAVSLAKPGLVFATFKAEVIPAAAFARGIPASMEISDIKFTRKRGVTPHTLEGRLTNRSAFRAKSVVAIVALYGNDGKIVGADQAIVSGGELDAGQSSTFATRLFHVAANPETYVVKAVGYGDG